MRTVMNLSLTILLAFWMLACSAVKFDKPANSSSAANAAQGGAGNGGDSAGGSVSQTGGAGDGSAGGQITQGAGPNGGDVSNSGGAAGVITGVGAVPAAELPKLQFIGPPCMRLTECAVTFQLDKTYPYTTEFDWKTNDTLYGTPAGAGLYPWGKPGYPGDLTAQYVPTSGHVVFPAGSMSQTVHVRNINQQDVPISIGVLMTNCVYNTLLESCQKFFNQ